MGEDEQKNRQQIEALSAEIKRLNGIVAALSEKRFEQITGKGSMVRGPSKEELKHFARARTEHASLEDVVKTVAEAEGVSFDEYMQQTRERLRRRRP